MWAAAALAHLAGNPFYGDMWPRHAGVLLGLAFHGLVSLDVAQHFYDFTAVLLALFVLFLSEDVGEAAERMIASVPEWRAQESPRSGLRSRSPT
jgi:hypothetical protein